MKVKKRINIFVVSPSDTKIQREIAREVSMQFNSLLPSYIQLKSTLWEYHPLPAYKNPQNAINNALEKADIYIVILNNSIGQAVPNLVSDITKTDNSTGTQYEIEWLLKNKEKHVYIFRKINNNGTNIELNNYLKKIGLEENTTKMSYQSFTNNIEFKEKIITHLSTILNNDYNLNLEIDYLLNPPNILKKEVNPKYYVGLYMVLLVAIISGFMYVVNNLSDNYNIRTLYTLFSMANFLMIYSFIKNLPKDFNTIYETSFFKIVSALIVRTLFLFMMASMSAFVIWYFLLPPLKQILRYIFM